MKLLALIALFFLINGCDESNSGSGGSSKGNVSVKLSSVAAREGRISSCSLSLLSGNFSGKCLSPLSLKAKAGDVSAATTTATGTGPGRLIQMNAAPSGLGLQGPFGVLGLASFDFSNPTAAKNEYSDDNLQDQTANPVFNLMTVSLGSLDVQIEIPSANTNVTNRFWTIRYPFNDQNPLQNSAFASCPSDSGTRGVIESGGNLFTSPSSFKQGDILVCRKSASSTACEDSDFVFIDSSTGSTSTTRPTSPVRLTGTLVNTTISCSEGTSTYPEMVFGGSSLTVGVTSPFKIRKYRPSEGAEMSPYQYEFTSNCSISTGECTGTTTTATKITVDVSFPLSDLVFVQSGVDLETDPEATILKNLEKVMPKPLFALNQATEQSQKADSAGVSATVTITQTAE